MPKVAGAPTRAQTEFLAAAARAGGIHPQTGVGADDYVRHGSACVTRGWMIHEIGIYALTWSGWQAVPKWTDAQASAAAGLSVETWNAYTRKGHQGAPPADGWTSPAGRPVRFWWTWTVLAWVEARGGPGPLPDGRPVGAQCVEPHPTRVNATCRATITNGVCTNGHRV